MGDQMKAPQPPFINKLPKFARYEMILEPGTQEKAADPKTDVHLSKVEITKTDDIKLISTTYSNGVVRELWSRKGFMLLEQSKPKAVLIYRIGDLPVDLPVGADDFFDLGWLSASNYKSVVSYQGKKCYLFENGAGRRALVDVTTKLPQMVSRGTAAWRYTYDPAPAAMLQFSPAFAAAWDENQKNLKALSGTSGPR